ncbi:hypothetical protein D3C80_2128350 [compost metagenome]
MPAGIRNTATEFSSTTKMTKAFFMDRVYFRAKSLYATMELWKRRKENTVWLKVFTTAIPRTYSTAELFISSRWSW